MPLDLVRHYATEKGDELTERLPVKREADEGHTVVFDVPVFGVKAGDILAVKGRIQGTNNLHKPIWSLKGRVVGFGTRLKVLTIKGEIPMTANWCGGNLDQIGHHGTRPEEVDWLATEDYGDVRVRFYAKSASTGAKTSGPKKWFMEIDKGYGHMTIMHLRQTTPVPIAA